MSTQRPAPAGPCGPCGPAGSWPGAKSLPLRDAFFTSLPVSVWFSMSLPDSDWLTTSFPVMDKAAYDVPPVATTRARTEMIVAGVGRLFLSRSFGLWRMVEPFGGGRRPGSADTGSCGMGAIRYRSTSGSDGRIT